LRASSLSDAKIISLLNRYFVPVYISDEDVAASGSASAREKLEYRRIYSEALKAGLSTGTVHVYILTPDGHPLDSLHVAKASQPEQLTALLERAIEKLKPTAGPPVVKPAVQSKPPAHDAKSLVLHLTARVLKPGCAWDQFPAENWIVLPRADWAKFLPPGHIAPGKSWDIDKETAAKLLVYFYPATENNSVSTNRIEEQELKGQVLSTANGVLRVRLSGKLKMKHTFYYKDDSNVVEANLIGFVDVDQRKNTIRSFRLVTDEATYWKGTFGVAVRSVP
jgi:hypothetical protein